MATIFAHSLVGGTIASLVPNKWVDKDKHFYFWMFFLPIVPDFDYFGLLLNVPYPSLFGHRGFTHSIFFSLIFAGIAALVIEKKSMKKYFRFIFYFVTMMTHGLLDALTNGGLGVAFFSPFNKLRYFFFWTPIEVSPFAHHFLTHRGFIVLISEFYWVGLLCAFLLVLQKLLLKIRANK